MEDSKLYVNNTSAKSPYWKHFGYPLVDGEVDKMLAVCKMCKTKVRHSKNTTNLRNHLEKWHPELFKPSEDPDSGDISPGLPTPNHPVDSRISHKFGQITNKVTRFIVEGLRPFSVVDDPSFIALLRECEPRYSVPNSKHFATDMIPRMYEETLSLLRDELCGTEKVCLTLEHWISTPGERHVAVTTHFITRDMRFRSRLLETIRIRSEDGEKDIAAGIKGVIEKWQLPTHSGITAVSDSDITVMNAVRMAGCHPVVECLADKINQAANKGFDVRVVADFLDSIKQITDFFHHNALAAEVLKEAQICLNVLVQRSILTSYGSEWYEHYDMLLNMMSQHRLVHAALTDSRLTILCSEHNIKPLTKEQRSFGKELIATFHSLKNATLSVTEEKYLSVSCVLPIITSVLRSVTPTDKDCEILSAVKKNISDSLNSYRSDIRDHLLVASFVDPRFVHMTFLTQDKWQNCTDLTVTAIEELANLPDSHNSEINSGDHTLSAFLSSSSKDDDTDIEPSPKYIKLEHKDPPEEGSWVVKELEPDEEEEAAVGPEQTGQFGLSRLLGNVCTSKSNIPLNLHARAQMEVVKYGSEDPCGLTDDPLQWWRYREAMYPLLSRLARHVLCVPATSVPPEQAFNSNRDLVTARANLLDEHVNQMVFLQRNWKS